MVPKLEAPLANTLNSRDLRTRKKGRAIKESAQKEVTTTKGEYVRLLEWDVHVHPSSALTLYSNPTLQISPSSDQSTFSFYCICGYFLHPCKSVLLILCTGVWIVCIINVIMEQISKASHCNWRS